jgi:hypothetical protein
VTWFFTSVTAAIYSLVSCFSVMKQDSANHCSFSFHFCKHFVGRTSGSKKCVKYLLGPEGDKHCGGVSLSFNCNTHASYHSVILASNKSFHMALSNVLSCVVFVNAHTFKCQTLYQECGRGWMEVVTNDSLLFSCSYLMIGVLEK